MYLLASIVRANVATSSQYDQYVNKLIEYKRSYQTLNDLGANSPAGENPENQDKSSHN